MQKNFHLRKPGYWSIERLRDKAIRSKDCNEEHISYDFPASVQAANTQAEACFCNASSCETACPLKKPVPSIMQALKSIQPALLDALGKDETPEEVDDYFSDTSMKRILDVRRALLAEDKLSQEIHKLKEAWSLQMGVDKRGIATMPFAEFTGILCPAPCENGGTQGSGCTLKENLAHEAVRIRQTELDLHTIGFAMGWWHEAFSLALHVVPKKARVAIVGAGPAGIQAAYLLAHEGYGVTLFEKDAQIGGQLFRGIPDHKFAKHKLEKYRQGLIRLGIKVMLNHEATPSDLKGFDASLLAPGVMDNQYEVSHTEGYADALSHIHDAYGFLRKCNEATTTPPKPLKSIVVYGDGYTASDCVQSSIRHHKKALLFHAFRDNGITSPRTHYLGQEGGIDRSYPFAFSTMQEDKDTAKTLSIPGALLESFTPEDEGVVARFRFQKVEDAYLSLRKSEKKAHYTTDDAVGTIVKDGATIGLRLRYPDRGLVDFALCDGAFVPSDRPLGGEASGTLDIWCDAFVPAFGAASGAYENPLIKAWKLNTKPYHATGNPEGVNDKGECLGTPGVFLAGDAAHVNQLIVDAQAHAKTVTNTILTYLEHRHG